MDAARTPPPGGLRDVLAGMLADTSLELAYPVGEPPRHVRADGRPADMEPGRGQQVTPLVRGSRTVAVLRHRAGLLDDPGLISEVAAAARLGMENERLHAEVLAQLEDLRAAQARIVTAGDAERQRLERDLHDGAQQQLVALSLELRLACPQPGSAPGSPLAGLIGQADRELRQAIGELRELAHGIYPAVLAEEGLAAAVEALTESSLIPVAIGHLTQQRLPLPSEAAGYFLIAQATQLAAQAGAAGVAVEAERAGDWLIVAITGHGSSGHDLSAGLCDAADRVGALGGQLRLEDIAGGAVTIRAEIPCV
jgi:signal transduction histidine kinase